MHAAHVVLVQSAAHVVVVERAAPSAGLGRECSFEHALVHTGQSLEGSGKVIRVANRGQWKSLHCIASE